MSSTASKASDYDIIIYGDRVLHKGGNNLSSNSRHNTVDKLSEFKHAKYVGDITLKNNRKYNNSGEPRKQSIANEKSVEDQNEEILRLKKKMAELNGNIHDLKTKNRHIEFEKKELEELYILEKADTEANSCATEIERTVKYKTLKLKEILRKKEDRILELESDIKIVNNKELKIQLEIYYNECLRLRKMSENTEKMYERDERTKIMQKLADSQISLIRVTKSYEETTKDVILAREEAERVSKENKALKAKITKLEEENTRFVSNLGMESTNELLLHATEDKLPSKYNKKVRLRGPTEERVVLLQDREISLLRKIQEMHLTIRRMSRKREVAENDTKFLKTEEPENKFLLAEYVDDKDVETQLNKEVENFTRKRASLVIQRNWRKQRTTIFKEREIEEFKQKIAAKKIHKFLTEILIRKKQQNFAKNRAARVIQRTFRRYLLLKKRAAVARQYKLRRLFKIWRLKATSRVNYQGKVDTFRRTVAVKIIQKSWRGYNRSKVLRERACGEIASCLEGHSLRIDRIKHLNLHCNMFKKEFTDKY